MEANHVTDGCDVLPPGQRELNEFPRFGLNQFAERFQKDFGLIHIKLEGELENSSVLAVDDFSALELVSQISDFHCVTTWSVRHLKWTGYSFKSFYERVVMKHAKPHNEPKFVVLKSIDGFRTLMRLEDCLNDNVLLATHLGDQPLDSKHGAPMRLVAPDHYGFKNIKHIKSIGFYSDKSAFKPASLAFMDHERARVKFEERGTGVPGWLLRFLYRPFIHSTIKQFKRYEK